MCNDFFGIKSAKVKLSMAFTSGSDSIKAPYTAEELHKRVAESERQYVAGEYYTQEEVHKLMEQFVQQQKANL